MKGKRTLLAAVVTTALAAAGVVRATTFGGRQRTPPVRGGGARCGGDPRPLPAGVVRLLMTDVAGSTRMWEERADIAGAVLERHEAFDPHARSRTGRRVVTEQGRSDSTFSVFANACEAATAGVEIQRALQREAWPEGAAVRVRAALYTGEVERRDGTCFGPVANRCARLRAAVHPGQTVCSQSTEARLAGLSAEIVRTDLGRHRLRDIARAERIFQLGHGELCAAFPPLRTAAARTSPPAGRTSGAVRIIELVAV